MSLLRNLLSLTLPILVAAADPHVNLTLPASTEFFVVFPQNKTYDIVLTFPVIFAVGNGPVLFSLGGSILWNIQCANESLFGDKTVDPSVGTAPSTSLHSYYWIDESTSADTGQLKLNATADQCTLSWSFIFPACSGGYFSQIGTIDRQGSVNFTLKAGAQLPKDSISNYDGCAEPGVAVDVSTVDEQGCPLLESPGVSLPKSCDLDVKPAASSLAAALASPALTVGTTTKPFTATPITAVLPSATNAVTSSSASTGPSNGKNGGKKSRATSLTANAGVLTVALTVVIVSPVIWFNI